jgi:transposase
MAKFSLSSLQTFVSGFDGKPFWIGLDVHKRSYYVALLRPDGRSTTWVASASPDEFIKQVLCLGINIAAVAYETGPTGFALARALEKSQIPVIVAAASRIPRSVTAGAKCDRLDCIKLADYAARGMLKSIAVPTPEEEARRSLLRRRHSLVDSVRRSKQRIKSLLLFLGVREPIEVTNWSKKAPDALLRLTLEPFAKQTLESHLRELTFQQTELRTVEDQLRQIVATTEQKQSVAYLQTVPGVGVTVATSYALELFRPERFARAEEVASYLGLAPVVRHSGGKTPNGRLVPTGQTRLRSLLIEAAWMWKAKDATAAELYNKLLSRTGIAQKAIAAVARRLAIILWRLMVEQRSYRMAGITAS